MFTFDIERFFLCSIHRKNDEKSISKILFSYLKFSTEKEKKSILQWFSENLKGNPFKKYKLN